MALRTTIFTSIGANRQLRASVANRPNRTDRQRKIGAVKRCLAAANGIGFMEACILWGTHQAVVTGCTISAASWLADGGFSMVFILV